MTDDCVVSSRAGSRDISVGSGPGVSRSGSAGLTMEIGLGGYPYECGESPPLEMVCIGVKGHI